MSTGHSPCQRVTPKKTSLMREGELRLTGQLITRQIAATYRNRIRNLLEKRDFVTVDLSEIELITPSFADECFGILAKEHGKAFFRSRLHLKGASRDVRHLISVVIANRLKEREA